MSSYAGAVTALAVRLQQLRAGIEESCLERGLSYPWWIPTYSTIATLGLSAGALLQRWGGSGPVWTSWLALVLTAFPTCYWLVRTRLLPLGPESVMMLAAVALYLRQPALPDLASLVLMIRCAEVAATSRLSVSIAFTLTGAGILGVATGLGHLQGAALYIIGLVLGLVVGFTLLWYMRALAAERASAVIVREQGRRDERRRIAREVHDVVGHSMSITMLHVTAARHALQQHADIDDAVESLIDAERVGRSAMTDLRATVAALTDDADRADGAASRALPGLADIPELVEQCRSAGLDIQLRRAVGTVRVSDVTALEIYRIAQESLANVAKHAPAARVNVQLVGEQDTVRLSVRSTLPSKRPAPGTGNGLPGMAARARQIGADLRTGVDGDAWLVEVRVPQAVG